jgi:hypothetical protein
VIPVAIEVADRLGILAGKAAVAEYEDIVPVGRAGDLGGSRRRPKKPENCKRYVRPFHRELPVSHVERNWALLSWLHVSRA